MIRIRSCVTMVFTVLAIVFGMLRDTHGYGVPMIVYRSGNIHTNTRVRQTFLSARRNNALNHPTPSSSSSPPKRREKKNKYQKQSKVGALDPLEELLAESERKNRQIVDEQTAAAIQSQPPRPTIDPLPPAIYPDTRTIDPYDPQTFGYLEIAHILGAHGVHGWIKVRATTDFGTVRLGTPGMRHLQRPRQRAPRPVALVRGKAIGNSRRSGGGDTKNKEECNYLIQLDGVESRDEAHRLRGSRLYVRSDDVSASAEEHGDSDSDDGDGTAEKVDSRLEHEDEYLVEDLVGLEVFLESDDAKDDARLFVGTVGGVVFAEDLCAIPGLGHDYLELILPRGIGGTTSWRDELVLIPMVPQIVPKVELSRKAIYIDPPMGLLDLTYVRSEKTRIKGFLPSSEAS